MRPLTLAAIISLVLTLAPRGYAAESLKAREKAAKKACAAGDFRKGVDILAELYVDTNNATYVFNQGRCYEENHQWVSAIDRFREFQRKTPDATPSSRAEVEKHIADCEAFRAQEEPRQLPAPVTPPPPLPAPVAAPLPAPERVVVTQPAAPKVDRGRGLRVSGIIVGSVGAASALVGLALNLKANSLANDYNRDKDAGTRSSHSTYKTGSMIGYGAGAGLLATGVVLYLIGRSAADESTQVSFLPLLTTTGFSLSARREF